MTPEQIKAASTEELVQAREYNRQAAIYAESNALRGSRYRERVVRSAFAQQAREAMNAYLNITDELRTRGEQWVK